MLCPLSPTVLVGNPPCVGRPPPLLIAPTKLWVWGDIFVALLPWVEFVSWGEGKGQNNLVLGAQCDPSAALDQ